MKLKLLNQLEEREQRVAAELEAAQIAYCGLQTRLSEMEVAIREIRGTRQASDVVQRCPFEQVQETSNLDGTSSETEVEESSDD